MPKLQGIANTNANKMQKSYYQIMSDIQTHNKQHQDNFFNCSVCISKLGYNISNGCYLKSKEDSTALQRFFSSYKALQNLALSSTNFGEVQTIQSKLESCTILMEEIKSNRNIHTLLDTINEKYEYDFADSSTISDAYSTVESEPDWEQIDR